MPFWQGFTYQNGILTLTWGESVDFEGDEIVYDVQCADNVDFNNSIVDDNNLSAPGDKLEVTSWGSVNYKKTIDLNVGDHYFMKVIAKEKNNPSHYQIAFDKEIIINKVNYFGVLEFVIE